jgi:hypothetical protein
MLHMVTGIRRAGGTCLAWHQVRSGLACGSEPPTRRLAGPGKSGRRGIHLACLLILVRSTDLETPRPPDIAKPTYCNKPKDK